MVLCGVSRVCTHQAHCCSADTHSPQYSYYKESVSVNCLHFCWPTWLTGKLQPRVVWLLNTVQTIDSITRLCNIQFHVRRVHRCAQNRLHTYVLLLKSFRGMYIHGVMVCVQEWLWRLLVRDLCVVSEFHCSYICTEEGAGENSVALLRLFVLVAPAPPLLCY